MKIPCRNEIKGVSAGVASSFISRNNDIDGYWAMGIFYSEAAKAGKAKFELDLISGLSSPTFKYSKRVAANYFKYIVQQFEKKGFEEHQIVNAIVELEFNVQLTSKQIIYKNTWGNPFICRVTITDDLMKKHIYALRGWCDKHDPEKELRSTRRYAL